jgi:hypothetical protein
MPFAPIMFANGTSPGDDSAYPGDWPVPPSATATASSQLPPANTPFPPATPSAASDWPGLLPPPPNSWPWSAGLPWGLLAPPAAEPTLRAPLTTPAWVTDMSLLGRIGQMENPFVPGGPPRDMSMSLFPRPPGVPAVPNEPGRDGLLGLLPTLWESGPEQSNGGANASSYQPAAQTNIDDLVSSGLALSKTGAPFFQPPPPSPLDIPRFLVPNLVDYLTRPAPPLPPFPSTPGKIPPADANPYFGPAVVDAVNLGTTVLGGVEGLGPVLAGLAAKAPILAMPGLSAAELAAARGTLVAGPIRLVGRSAEEAVGIPLNAPKPSIQITSSGAIRHPDRLTPWTLEEVKNVKHLAFTQQMSDYLEYAQENGLTFILHTRPQTTYSRTLQALIDAGHIVRKDIPGFPK